MDRIKKVGADVKAAIQRKSAYALPDNPTALGWRASDIKKTLYQPIIDGTNSTITEIDRVVDEVNGYLNYAVKELDSIVSVVGIYYHSSMGLIYALSEEGFTVSGYEGEEVNIVIPTRIYYEDEYVKVVGIAKEAFKGKLIESIEIPETVEIIGDSAFASCMKLATVVFKGISALGSEVFGSTNTVYTVPKEYLTAYQSLLERYVLNKETQILGKNTVENNFRELQKAQKMLDVHKKTIELHTSQLKKYEDPFGEIEMLRTKVENNTKEIEATEQTINEIQADQAVQDSSISKNAADIQKLYSLARESIHFNFLKTEQAYTTRQTANGAEIFDEQYTPVKEIKGSTVRCENLINLYDWSIKGYKGIDILCSPTDGSITIKGTATSNGGRLEFLSEPIYLSAEEQYSLTPSKSTSPTAKLCLTNSDDEHIHILGGSSFAPSVSGYYQLGLNFAKGMKYDTTFYPMLNVGSTLKEHQPYFSGLKRANISAIKSTGRNLWNSNDGGIVKTGFAGLKEIGKLDWTTMWAIPVPKNTPITFSIKKLGTGSKMVYVAFANDIKIGTPVQIDNKIPKYYDNWDKRTTNSGDNKYLLLCNRAEEVPKDMMINIGDTASEYTPYTEELYELPETLELSEYDSFNPQTGEIIRQTKQYTFKGTETYADYYSSLGGVSVVVNGVSMFNNNSLQYIHNGVYKGTITRASVGAVIFNNVNSYFSSGEEFMAWLKTQHDNGTPVIVDCKKEKPTIEKIENAPKLYKAWRHGSETIIQGETDNSIYGAMPTIKNEYFVEISLGEEEANE